MEDKIALNLLEILIKISLSDFIYAEVYYYNYLFIKTIFLPIANIANRFKQESEFQDLFTKISKYILAKYFALEKSSNTKKD